MSSYFCHMQVDYIIVGQGLCGTFLSWEMQKAGLSFLVMDELRANSASRVASGVINPVTGRRIVKTWMIEELMPFCWDQYSDLGSELGVECIAEKQVVDLFASPQMRLAFLDRYAEDQQFLGLPSDENDLRSSFNYDFGYGIIQPAYLVNLQEMLPAYRKRLQQSDRLIESKFHIDRLQVKTNAVHYDDISANKIIFCDGVAGFDNPYFKNLPYGANKGEALLVSLPGLQTKQIVKKGFSLVPWKEDIFWLGSTYLWEFENDQPTPGFKQFAENWLKMTTRTDYKILDHMAAIRPATLERRPFVGFHPLNSSVGILNGMGTKGCSLAPFFAKQLVDHLATGAEILPGADVKRFTKVLSR